MDVIGHYLEDGSIRRESDGTVIPPGHRWFAELLAQTDQGAIIVPWEAPPPAVPAEISSSQLFLGLTAYEFITPQEALDAARTGAVPAAIDALFDQLPPEEALAARVRWARMTTVERNHPLVAALAAANNLSEQDIDDAFIAWSQL